MLLLYTAMIDPPKEKRKFERLYHQYRQTMYRAAYSILQDAHEAEDAVHMAFEKIIDHLEKINENDCHKTKAFLVIVVESAAIDLYRKRKRGHGVPYEELEPFVEDGTGSDHAEKDAVSRAIARLPVAYSTVLRLKYSHGYENREIAAILKISEDNVRQRIFRAKKRLAELLEEEGIIV